MTSIEEILEDGELTADARPEPPRDEGRNRETVVEEPLDDEKQPTVQTKTSIPQTCRNPKKSKQKSSNQMANIINIANCNGVQIGKSITYNIHKSPSRYEEKERNYIKTESINKLLNSNELVTKEHILFVSSHVGKGWRDIGRLLNYSEGQSYQFEETHRFSGVKEVVYHLLLDWIQNEPDDATLGKLTNVLWDSRQEEVVQLLSKKFSF